MKKEFKLMPQRLSKSGIAHLQACVNKRWSPDDYDLEAFVETVEQSIGMDVCFRAKIEIDAQGNTQFEFDLEREHPSRVTYEFVYSRDGYGLNDLIHFEFHHLVWLIAIDDE